MEDPVQQKLQEIPSTNACTVVASSPASPSTSHPEEHTDSTEDKPGIEQPQFPYLDIQSLTEDEKHALYGRLTNEYKDINSSYARLNIDIRNSLQTRGVTPGQLADVLMELSAFPLKVKDTDKPLLEDCFDEIEDATSIHDIFKILRPYGSFFDCHIIKHIVNSTLCTYEDRNKLQRYLSELDDYCQRNVFECQHFASPDPKFPKLILKVDSLVSKSFSMKSLDAFSANVAKTFGISRHTLRLCSVDEGCVQLTYQIPQSVVDRIFPLSPEQEEAPNSLGWKYKLSSSQTKKIKVSSSALWLQWFIQKHCFKTSTMSCRWRT